MDLIESIAPKSDQLNADDLIGGPRTFTIERVSEGSLEQPINFHLAELPGRPYRPSKTQRRVMVEGWKVKSASQCVGKRITLYRDPNVMFGGEKIGGLKISHMSDIEAEISMMLTDRKGHRSKVTVSPLLEPSPAQVAASTNQNELRGWWKFESLRPAIKARIDQLSDVPAESADDEAAQLFADGA